MSPITSGENDGPSAKVLPDNFWPNTESVNYSYLDKTFIDEVIRNTFSKPDFRLAIKSKSRGDAV